MHKRFNYSFKGAFYNVLQSSTTLECSGLHELIVLNNSNSVTGSKNIEFKLLGPIVLKILQGIHRALILPAIEDTKLVKKIETLSLSCTFSFATTNVREVFWITAAHFTTIVRIIRNFP